MTIDPFQTVKTMIEEEKNRAFEHWEHTKGAPHLRRMISLSPRQSKARRLRLRILIPITMTALLLSILSIHLFTPRPETGDLRIRIENALQKIQTQESTVSENLEQNPAPEKPSPPDDEEWKSDLYRMFEQLAQEKRNVTAQNLNSRRK